MAAALTFATFGALVLVGLGSGACSPEILIASSDSGGAGTTGGSAVSGTAGVGGNGGTVGSEPSEAGQAGEAAAPEAPRLLADSVADFALVQGEHGWYYGYDDGTSASYLPMTRISVITTYTPESGDVWECWANDSAHWTQIFQLGAHGNGTDTSPPSVPVLERAVRRWVSSYEGDVKISGEAAKIDVAPMGSNGVDARVVVDGVELYSAPISGEDAAGLSYELTAHVNVGSTVDFVLDPRDGDDHHDLSRFTGVIERVLETGEP